MSESEEPLRWKGTKRNWQRVGIVHLNPDQIDKKGALNIESPNTIKKGRVEKQFMRQLAWRHSAVRRGQYRPWSKPH
jgi:hypothetical protein